MPRMLRDSPSLVALGRPHLRLRSGRQLCERAEIYVSLFLFLSLLLFFPRSKVRNAFRTFSTGVREIFPLLSCRRTVIISIQLVHLHSHPVPQHPTSTRLVGGTVHV